MPSSKMKVSAPESQARNVRSRPINRETTIKAQAWILHTQIAWELQAGAKAEVVVCDRAVLDNYCYLKRAAPGDPHVKVLEEAGLVRREIRWRTHVCSLEPGPLADAHAWLAFYEGFWNDRLDALERLLREAAKTPDPKPEPEPKSEPKGDKT